MFTRRLKIILLCVAVLDSVLVLRLYWIGIVEHEHWLGIAESKPKIPFRPIPAKRGRILAYGGGSKGHVELVSNEPCFELTVFYPMMCPDKWWLKREMMLKRRELIKKLGKNAKITQEQIAYMIQQERQKFWQNLSRVCDVSLTELLDRRDRIVEIIQRRIAYIRRKMPEADYPIIEQRMYHPVVWDIDEQKAIELRNKLEDDNRVMIRPAIKRVYRYPELLCHIIGRTVRIPGSVPKTFEILDKEYLPGELQGLSGIEKSCDEILRGRRGWVELGENPRIKVPAEDGRDIILTVDVELQEFVERLLSRQVKSLPYATGGAAVVVDLQNNSILALASYPSYNLSRFQKDYPVLRNDYLRLPLFDRALQGRYPPGSIVKPLVAAWALTLGKITPHTSFLCKGYLSEKMKRFRCWYPPPGHGYMSMISGIYNSCDVYFYHLGELIGVDELSRLYRRVGFGKKVYFPVSNSAGLVPTQKWFVRRWGRGMSVGDARNLAIGQGDLLVTPVQAAIMLKALLTNEYRAPKLFVGERLPEAVEVGLSKKAIELAKEGMDKTVNLKGATAYRYVHCDEIRLAGKTGSAQAPSRRIYKISYVDKKSGKSMLEYSHSLKYFLKRHKLRKRDVSYRVLKFPVLKEEDRMDAYGRRRTLAHGWFVGYGSSYRPRIVASVFIEYGISGGYSAGPVFKQIMLKCKELGYLN